ncbi:hypothetical protein KSS87_003103, partial [Heliosperma pusillum]
MEFQTVKQELLEESARPRSPSTKSRAQPSPPAGEVIELSDSDDEDDIIPAKKRKVDGNGALPPGFLDPLPPLPDSSLLLPPPPPSSSNGCKSFWKAGDYEGSPCDGGWDNNTGGMDHVRVHPKFLHSNATSHKWALGAFAELLDNSLDEVCYGATYVNIDMLLNKKDGNRMLLVEDFVWWWTGGKENYGESMEGAPTMRCRVDAAAADMVVGRRQTGVVVLMFVPMVAGGCWCTG